MINKVFIFVLIMLFIHNISFSQSPSKIKPVKVVWVADGDTLTIEEAQKGIEKPTKLEIVAILNTKTIGDAKNNKLEFRWYKKGPTRWYLTNTFPKKINFTSHTGLAYKVSTSRGNLKNGWWKVQIESFSDRKLLSYKNKQEFYIQFK